MNKHTCENPHTEEGTYGNELQSYLIFAIYKRKQQKTESKKQKADADKRGSHKNQEIEQQKTIKTKKRRRKGKYNSTRILFQMNNNNNEKCFRFNRLGKQFLILN